MGAQVDLSGARLADVSVHLCSRKLRMPQQFLYGAQVCSSIEEVCRESVAEGVGCGWFLQSGPGAVLLQKIHHAAGGQTAPKAIEEQCIGGSLAKQLGTGVLEIVAQGLPGWCAEQGDSLFGSLSPNAQFVAVPVNTAQVQAGQFAHPQACSIQDLQDGAVTYPLRVRLIGRAKQGHRFLH